MNGSSNKLLFTRLGSIALIICLIFALLPAPMSLASSAGARASYIVQGTSTDQVISLILKYDGIVTSHLDVINGAGALLTAPAVVGLRTEQRIKSVILNTSVYLADDNGKGGGKGSNTPPADSPGTTAGDNPEEWGKGRNTPPADSPGTAAGDNPEEGGKGKNSPSTDYPDVVGADVTWQGGAIGQGITVAVVDTGLGSHKAITRDINGKQKGRIVGWVDFVDHQREPQDPNGHGTHVAGIIANTQIGQDGEWNGVAPGVSLVGVRVLDQTGAGSYESVIQGVQWVIDHKEQYNIRVMNLSLVSTAKSPYWADPLDQAVMRAWANGIIVVVAAGNGGPNPMTIGVPANTPYVLTVGAFTDNYTPNDWSDDYITPFSAAGPTLDGFVKPDVVAPGAHMVSSMLPNSYIARHHDANQVSNQYFSMAGTSQAAAVVSGIAALTLSQNPGLTPDQVKYRIMYTAYPWVDLTTNDAIYSMWQQGAGRVDAPDAVYADISGQANAGMDIQADIAGTQHYEGFSNFDKTTGEFRLKGDFQDWTGKYGNWSGGYGNWSGGYGSWSGKYGNWSGGYGNWSGGYGNWSGGYGNWSGGYGNWSGGYGSWSGKYGNWSGGYGNWSGGYGNWSGSVPWSGSNFAKAGFLSGYMAGKPPSAVGSALSIDKWVQDQ
jgi:subtilisin family serine protease